MLKPRQDAILKIFLEDPAKPRAVSDFGDFEVDRTTLFRDLQELSKLKILLPSDATRARTYALNPKSEPYIEWDLTRPPYERPAVKYDPKILGSYRPNKTFLLSDDQRKRMAAAGNISELPPEAASGKNYERLLASLLIDLAHASSSLEGIAISWLDTKTLIEFGEMPRGLDEKQIRIVLNHKSAISHIVEHGKDMSLGRQDLFDIHRLLTEGLLADRSSIGALRSRVVRFDDSKYLPPDNPHQLKEIFEEFCSKAKDIEDPYEQAFFAMSFLPYIQPFEDGNKRTFRLAMNIPLIRQKLAPFSFSDIKKRDYMFGLLAVYEKGNFDFLARAFASAYELTAKRYSDMIDYVREGGILSTVSEQKRPEKSSSDQGDSSLPKIPRKRDRGMSR